MKFKKFITVPMIALLASCGTQTGEQVSKRVIQRLPEDVVQVEDDEKSQGLIDEFVKGVSRFTLEDALYSGHVGAELSASGKVTNFNLKEYAKLDATVLAGFKKYAQTEGENPIDLYRGYIGLSDLDVKASLQIPGVSQSGEGETPSLKVQTVEVDLQDISLSMYYYETADAAKLYVNMSDTRIQDLVTTVATAAGMSSMVDTILDSILGAKEEGQQYRPGKFYIDVTNVIDRYLKSKYEEGEIPAEYLDVIKHPFKFLNDALVDRITSAFTEEVIGKVVETIENLKPAVGAKYDDQENLSKVSLVWNSTVKNAIKEIGGDSSVQLPVSGSFGLEISVGNEHGSKALALQELLAKADIKGSVNNGTGRISVSGAVDVECEAYYGEQAVVPAFPDSDNFDNYVSNQFVEEFILSKISNQTGE